MRRLRTIRITPGTVLATIALFLALGGVSYAAATLPRNSVTTVQVKDHSLLAKDFARGQIPRGPVGPAGPAGSAAASKWVLVNPNGSIAAQSGGISITTHTTGDYIVNFGSAVDT